MKKILVPTDFSEQSEYALHVAAQIAKKANAEIVVTHMMGLHDTIINTTDNRSAEQALFQLKLSQKNFQSFLDKAYLKGIDVTDTVENHTVLIYTILVGFYWLQNRLSREKYPLSLRVLLNIILVITSGGVPNRPPNSRAATESMPMKRVVS